MKVHLLGSGGASSGPRRANTTLAFSNDSSLLLAECSGNPVQLLLRGGMDPMPLEHVFISHRHADHLYALPSLVHQLYIGNMPKGRETLTVWGHESALQVVRLLLEGVGLFDKEALFDIHLRPLPLEEHMERIGELSMTTFPVDHGDVPTLGISVTTGIASRGVAVYSADTQPCDSVLSQARGANLLFHECSFMGSDCMHGHTALGHVPSMLEKTDVSQVVLVHLPPMKPGEEKSVGSKLLDDHGGRVLLGEDGTVFSL